MANTGRRARNRAARHKQITEAASAILSEEGIAALTMQEVADRVDCAVGTIYTYFNSKSALLAALQMDAIRVLADSHEAAASAWEERFEAMDVDPQVAAVTRMFALTKLLLSWPELQPREFDFLQVLITTQEEVISMEDAVTVIPQALTLFAEGRVLIDAAVDLGVFDCDPDRPGDDGRGRTVRWMAATEGSVLVAQAGASVADIDPDAWNRFNVGLRNVADLMMAWGASRELIEAATSALDDLEAADKLLPAAI
ncbi:MAG: helix-turn-helix transcriptional regulator [Actinomycetia bacterium]|nr:helix-turn-helix transcriptional regulator [Actinomycetes bacterium]